MAARDRLDGDTSDDANRMKHPHEHAAEAGAPGASGPGEPGFEGRVTIGEEDAAEE